MLFLWIIILLISIYISSLNSYKESDFNIPDNYFDTKYSDKDENAEENGFIDFVELNNILSKKDKGFDLLYFDKKSQCIFDNKKYSCEYLENNNINKNDFYKFKSFILSNKKEFEKINNKEYIKQTSEYLLHYWKDISYSWLLSYFRSSRYLVNDYFEKWKYYLWIDILLNNQKFIDNLFNKSDINLIWWIVLITIEKINLESIEYFIKKYELNAKNKEKIKVVLEKKLDNWLIENWIKHEYFFEESIFKSFWIKNLDFWIFIKSFSAPAEIYDYTWPIFILKNTLLFSEKESLLLIKKMNYEIIRNRWSSDFKVNLNLNNYWGREFINIWTSNFENQFKKEEDLLLLRETILEKLK